MKALYLFLILLISNTYILAINYDTGYIEYTQPNDSTFTARSWGDEFIHWMETDDGYRIVKGSNDYYFYAKLDSNGEFEPTTSKVGIDSPVSGSYKLNRSSARLDEIKDDIEDFVEDVSSARTWYESNRSEISVGVVLVDFSTSMRYGYPNDVYDKDYFDDMFFSQSSWTHPTSSESTCGSLWEYFDYLSMGELDLVGNGINGDLIVNPIDTGNDPYWYSLDNTKEYYETVGDDGVSFINDVFDELEDQTPSIESDDYDIWVFIYAGEWPSTGNSDLWPRAYPFYDNTYFMSELGTGLSGPNSTVFNHIGPHAHEFSHLIGARDEYNTSGDWDGPDPGRWELMAWGAYNGPQGNDVYGSCPAGLSPFYRAMHFEWVDVLTTYSSSGFTIDYDYDDPIYYKIDVPYSENGEYFLLENRLRDGFDEFTPYEEDTDYSDSNDPNGDEGGLLIWHIDPTALIPYGFNIWSDRIELEFANNIESATPGHPFPYINGNGNGNSLTDYTTPSSNKRDGHFSYVEIDQIFWSSTNENTNVRILCSAEEITSNTTWSTDQELTESLFILNGATLAIQAGVDVEFTSQVTGEQLGIYIDESSSLIVDGNGTNPVTFSSTNTDLWKGFYLYDGSTLDIEYADIDDIVQFIRHTESDCDIDISNSNVIMTDYNSDNTFIKCPFDLENSRLENLGNYKIDSSGSISAESIEFINTKFQINSGSSIAKSLFIEDGIGGSAVIYSSTQGTDSFDFLNNVIDGYGVGIESGGLPISRTNVALKNNIIMNCGTGINWFGTIDNEYNLFYNNTTNGSTGSNYLTDNPDLKTDYSLEWYSPCINAGDPDMTADDDGSVAEIGAFPLDFWDWRGDVELDEDWDVADVVQLVCIIMSYSGCENPGDEEQLKGDVVRDGSIDVLDNVALVDCIMDTDCPTDLERKSGFTGVANLSTNLVNRLGRGENEQLVISVDSNSPIRGLQADLSLQDYELVDIELTEIANGFELDYNQLSNGLTRILIHPEDSFAIPAGEYDIVVLALSSLERSSGRSNISAENIIISDANYRNMFNSSNSYSIIESYTLLNAYPNPFNPTTTISYELPEDVEVNLNIFDVNGRLVAKLVENKMQHGYQSVVWNGVDIASGVYFVRLETEAFTESQKLILLK